MKKYIYLVAAIAIASLQIEAQAAGFEKNVVWSGKYVGLGGAASSSVSGSEALYFNPAGLAAFQNNGDISLNLSPTFGHYSGPMVSASVIEESDKAFSPIGGVMAAYKITEKLGVGTGFYVSGGTKAIFENVNLSAATGASNLQLSPEIQSALMITEFALGAGYELIPGLRLGAAWRIVRVGGDFYTASAGTTPAANFTYVRIADVKDTRYSGFKLGAQYEAPSKAWGIGTYFRNNVNFNAAGTSSGQFALFSGTTPTTLAGGATTITSSFPWQAALGGHFSMTESMRLYLEFTHTDYSRVQTLVISGPIGTGRIPNVTTNWRDQNNFRLGLECTELAGWALRAGYVYTTQVVPNQRAVASFSSPGVGHTIALGTGTSFLGEALELNGSLEYSFAKGTGAAPTAIAAEYKTSAYAAHLGTAYKF